MKTIEVFGVSNEYVASYVERVEVDNSFVEGLARNKHIVIFGASKQGKTALTNKHLDEDQFIRVNCAPESLPADIYKSVLRQSNIEFEVSRTEGSATEGRVDVGVKIVAKIPIFGKGEGEVHGELSHKNEEVRHYERIEYNLELPQDVAEILRKVGFAKRVILENFHYLAEEVQSQLAFHLRVFEDYNILFIILGIWRERNRLAQFNGDLQDRLIEIPVEPWERTDLIRVMTAGSEILRVKFPDEICDEIVDNSFDSIGVFQELCKECCLAAGILETREEEVEITRDEFERARERKLGDYRGRHIRSFETFIDQRVRSSENVPLFMAYYFLRYLFSLGSTKIESGISRQDLQEGIRAIHHRPEDVRPSDMTYFLKNLTANQIKKKINPPLFDYDASSRRINVIDSTLYFFLRNVNREEVLEELDTPDPLAQHLGQK